MRLRLLFTEESVISPSVCEQPHLNALKQWEGAGIAKMYLEVIFEIWHFIQRLRLLDKI